MYNISKEEGDLFEKYSHRKNEIEEELLNLEKVINLDEGQSIQKTSLIQEQLEIDKWFKTTWKK